jgi:hypothetical protein
MSAAHKEPFFPARVKERLDEGNELGGDSQRFFVGWILLGESFDNWGKVSNVAPFGRQYVSSAGFSTPTSLASAVRFFKSLGLTWR